MADRRFKVKKKPSQKRPHIALLVFVLLLIAGAVFMFWPPAEKIHQGLDVQGGLSVVLQASKADGQAASADEMTSAQAIVERRVNLLGASESSVQVQGASQLLVQIPGAVNQTEALNVIGQAGVLEFIDLSTVEDTATVSVINNGTAVPREYLAGLGVLGQIKDLPTNAELFVESGLTTVNGMPTSYTLPSSVYSNPLDPNQPLPISALESGGDWTPVQLKAGPDGSIFSGSNITQVSVGRESDTSPYYAVNITLDSTGASRFGAVTTKLYPTKGKVAIVLDGFVQSAPAVQSAITNGQVAITGSYTLSQANQLKTILQSGSLPVSLSVATSQVVGPTLGQDALKAGVLVAIIGLILVALYLIFFYRGLGVLTAAAIGVFALLYLGLLALLSFFGVFSLTLSGIAGIVLAIGVAADSSILVLERFKEEIRMGRSVRASSMTGVRHAIQTSIDADLVTLISALALFFIAVGSVKGFGLTLALGVLCDIVTMLFFKAPVIRLLAPKVIGKHPGFWGIKEDEQLAQASGELKRGVQHG